jgi:hypothetical protein
MCSDSLEILSETLLSLRRIQGDITINVHKCSCKVPIIVVIFLKSFNFLDKFLGSPELSNFMKIRSVEGK